MFIQYFYRFDLQIFDIKLYRTKCISNDAIEEACVLVSEECKEIETVPVWKNAKPMEQNEVFLVANVLAQVGAATTRVLPLPAWSKSGVPLVNISIC